MPDLQRYLDELTREGESDSQGGFTLDGESARRKLAAFAYRDPHHYLLSWIRAAVLGGARDLELLADQDRVSLSFDGADLQRHSLEAIFGALLVQHGNPRLYHLARGIEGARRLYRGPVELMTGGHCYRYLPQQMTPRVLPHHAEGLPPGWSSLRVTRHHGLRGVMRRLMGPGGTPPEVEFVRQACQGVCPGFLRVNGEPLEPPPGQPLLLYASARAPDPLLDFLGRRRPLVSTLLDCHSPLVILGSLQGQAGGRLVLVIGGVRCSRRPLEGLPGLDAIVYADHLTLDASDFEVVEDEVFQEVLKRIREVYREALPILLTDRSSQEEARDTGTAMLAQLLEQQSLEPEEALLCSALGRLPLLEVTQAQPGEPSYLSLLDLAPPRRVYLLSGPCLPGKGTSWPIAARLSALRPGLARLLTAAGVAFATDSDHDEETRGGRVLVFCHEREQALTCLFASASRHGHVIKVPIEGHPPLELDLKNRVVTGPDPSGRRVEMRWEGIQRFDIEQRSETGEDWLFLAVADGRFRILLRERCRTPGAQLDIRSLPATMKVPARFRGPSGLGSQSLLQLLPLRRPGS